ncbi:hypothetical protein TH66_01630 [Carbonactinospora thermoautotrophica]|uniref:Photosynthesis system II assembly factor Ycf48/Hcf136-like domain-containing protein n=2 Tax=Carbonactinospora thermoautotrophica TaxID=1469144 RepID=A0A132N6M6_9ACTN|nr:hypothetical protein LI90_2296 [Carbonactinospora thermoautotrophica]KWX05753.1 hypothetical protein TH66_01630 [Carbonactinospora thermoautotrophica]
MLAATALTGCGGGRLLALDLGGATSPDPLARSGFRASQAAEPRAATPGGPVPAGFVPVSVTALDPDTFWVLGTALCGHQSCTSLVRTRDGGRSFAALPAPAAPLAEIAYVPGPIPGRPDTRKGRMVNIGGSGTTTDVSVADVRFADPVNGWVYGGALFATHDGGATWTELPMPGPVTRLEAGQGVAWALTQTGPGVTLYQAGVTGDDWRPVPLPGGPLGSSADLAVVRDTAVVVADTGDGQARAFRVPPRGAPAAAPVSCRAGAQRVLSAAGDRLWLVCQDERGAQLARSTDGGRTFTPVPVPPGVLTPAPRTARLALPPVVGALSGQAALLGSAGQLTRTTDGGATWPLLALPGLVSTGRDPAQWRYAGFTGPSVGFVVQSLPRQVLWRTTDGGRTWSKVAFSTR